MVRRFIETEAASGLVLVVATAMALVWANSPWQHAYETLWHDPVVVQIGGLRLEEDLRHFVNDGLMALFFFVVGLEIKREFVQGDLAGGGAERLELGAEEVEHDPAGAARERDRRLAEDGGQERTAARGDAHSASNAPARRAMNR